MRRRFAVTLLVAVTLYSIIVVACHNINGPGINSPGGPEDRCLGGPFMSSYLVRRDHLCIDINGPGKT